MSILGIDYGTRKMGIAVSDDNCKIALPLTTIRGGDTKFLMAIEKIIVQRDIKKIVIGLPINLSGDESSMSKIVKDFAEKLKSLKIEIVLLDERLTSVQAERIIHEIGEKPSRKKSKVDRIAATLILQNYLDSQEQFYEDC